MEWLQAREPSSPLFPVHRLDRETTGVLLFARSREATDEARALFESREVAKDYLFITDREASGTALSAESFIERVGNEYVSQRGREPNSLTTFEFIRRSGRFSLWRARPATGKPHQIRLHAQDLGLPLLGDAVHGGSEFPALCLHSASLTIAGQTFAAPPPIYFDDLTLLADRQLVRWLAAIDRRERALRSVARAVKDTSDDGGTDAALTLRWIHTEGDPLRIEQLGPVVHLNWFSEQPPRESEWASIHRLLKLKGWTKWYLQLRADRGKDPQTDRAFASEPPPPDRWLAKENGLCYEFRRETGLSPGLFLDQRRNRAWLARTGKDKRVLNLFCYTGGFSVAAAAAGAGQVVSVDVSKPFLEWTKRNFELNGLATESHEFRSIDAGEYLAWALKKELKFDVIVCDPPSFARTNTRGKSSVFRIESEFEDLLIGCLKIANAGTKILFSTNYEQWTLDQFAERAQTAIKTASSKARVVATPSPDLDFELPRQPRHMKSLVIEV